MRQSSFLELYRIKKKTGNHTTVNLSHAIAMLANQLVIGLDLNRISRVRLSDYDINRVHQHFVFAEDRLKFSHPFSLVGGLRYDRPRITNTDCVNPSNHFTGTPDAITWRGGGAVYNPISTLSPYAQYATAADPVGALVPISLAQSAFDLSTGRQMEAGVWRIY